MKSLLKNTWLILGSAAIFTAVAPQICAGAPSNLGAVPAHSDRAVGNTSTVGLDGNVRLLFDIISPVTFTATGVNLWVVSPTGSVLAATSLPFPTGDVILGDGTYYYAQGQADGNTTVLGIFQDGSVNVSTYNSSGTMVANAVYGPFTNTTVASVKRQESTGKFLVTWAVDLPEGIAYAAWTVNEYGGVDTATGPYGPFANTTFEGINLLNDGSQQWIWASRDVNSTGTTTTGLWSITASGQVQSAEQFGPF